MKRLAIALLLIAGPAWGQAVELMPRERIELNVGQTRVFEAPTPFSEIRTEGGTVKATAHSDRRFSVHGLEAGETPLFVYGATGEVFRAMVTVGQEPGRVVRLYDGRSKDYTGYYCTDTSCGRADNELQGRRDPAAVSVTQRRPAEGGGFNEVTKTYGPGR